MDGMRHTATGWIVEWHRWIILCAYLVALDMFDPDGKHDTLMFSTWCICRCAFRPAHPSIGVLQGADWGSQHVSTFSATAISACLFCQCVVTDPIPTSSTWCRAHTAAVYRSVRSGWLGGHQGKSYQNISNHYIIYYNIIYLSLFI